MSPFVVIATAYVCAMKELGAREEVVFTTPFSGRTRSEELSFVGATVSVLPMVVQTRANLQEQLIATRDGLLESFEWQWLPFRWLMVQPGWPAWLTERTNALPFLGVDMGGFDFELGGLDLVRLPTSPARALTRHSSFVDMGRDEVSFHYDPSGVEPDQVRVIADVFGDALQKLAALQN